MPTVLRVEGLTKRYGDFVAVADVGFALAEGEAVAFLGANGAGKSTVIKMLCNLVRPSGGQAYLDGQPILGTQSVAHRAALGAVVEAPRFYPHLSGRRNLELVARLRGTGPDAAAEMLERVGLNDRAHERFGNFSQGMRQRLGLAAAFLHRPRLAILDEPTGGLDPAGVVQIHELIRALMRQQAAAVLLCTHQLAEAEALCRRALVIDRGRIVLDGQLDGGEGIAAVRSLFGRLARGGQQ